MFMKKIGLLLLVFLLTACAVKPDAVLSEYFNMIKSNDNAIYDAELHASYFDRDPGLNTEDTEELLNNQTEAGKELSTAYLDLVQEFEYTINNTTITDDKAVVNVTIKAYPLMEMTMDLMNRLMSALFSLTFTSEEETTAYMLEQFNLLKVDYTKSFEGTVDVYLVKVDKDWKIVGGEKNMPLFNALTGNLMNIQDELEY